MVSFSKWDGQFLEACEKGSGCVHAHVHTRACVHTPLHVEADIREWLQ